MPAHLPLLAFAAWWIASCTGAIAAQTPPPPATSPSLPSPNTLSAEIAALLRDPSVSHAHWGISVTQLDSTPLFTLDADKLFRPASTAKLFTTAAAMALLGPDHRFTTQIVGNLDPGGTVQGDLHLLGGGDPSFGTQDLPYSHPSSSTPRAAQDSTAVVLNELATQLVAAGVKRVTGHLLGEDTLFEAPAPPEGWAAEDLPWSYGALPGALSFNDNEFTLTVAPEAAPGTGTLVTIDQLVPWLRVTNDVHTRSAETPGVDAQPTRQAPQGLRLFGSVAPGSAPVHEHIALNDPAAYSAEALRALLTHEGIEVKGEARAMHSPLPGQPTPFLTTLHQPLACQAFLDRSGISNSAEPSCTPDCSGVSGAGSPLAQHLSPPLAEDIAFTLKTSANLHAELYLHHLGRLVTCSGVTTLQGARVLRAWLLHIGLSGDEVTLYDGSGLSTKDLVTPQAETQLLTYAAAQPWFPQWFAGLPVGGVDGTLAARFSTAPLQGHVFAKTGTLGETRALTGYLDCHSGKRVAFAILVDDHQPGSLADRTTADRIVAAIEKYN